MPQTEQNSTQMSVAVGKVLPRLAALVLLCVGGLWLASCSTLKNVPADGYLLDRVEIVSKDAPPDIDHSELERYIRQQPNNRLFGLYRFNLWLYNLGKPGKETGVSGWLHRIGEAPVVYSDDLTRRSVQNLTTYLYNRGFYHAAVTDSLIDKKRRRRKVQYKVHFGQPTTIDTLAVYIADSTIAAYYAASASLITPQARLDLRTLESERARLTTLLRNQGFYAFTAERIGFRVDTVGTPFRARLQLRILQDSGSEETRRAFRRYVIDSVRIFTKYDPLRPASALATALDSRMQDGLHYYFDKRPGIRLPVLAPLLLLRQDSLVRVSQVNRSQQNLLNLGLYQTASFNFRRSSGLPRSYRSDSLKRYYPINCDVLLTRTKLQGYQLEGMVTTSGSLGLEGSMTYRHRNLFYGAEQLELQFRAQAEAVLQKTAIGFKTALEIGMRASLSIPRFLLPFKSSFFVRRYSPKTLFLISYNFQRRPYYRRTVASGYVSYTWKGSPATSHSITPLEIDVLKIFAIDEAFAQRIRQTYLANSYISQFISLLSYSFSYSSNNANALFSTTLFKVNVESAGNMLRAAAPSLKLQQVNGVYQFFGLPFAQYAKGDVNYAVLFRPSRYYSLAARIFAGLGYPYGNSNALPFEKRYYEGGANGVRAWHARDLGPGSYKEERLSFPNQTGDLKLEGNIEYRSWLFWKFESALFLDVGNIWSITPEDKRAGAVFKPTSFYKELAMGYGLGLRLNLGVFLLRLDMGVKLHDPSVKEGDTNPAHWIPFDRSLQGDDLAFHFGVGYPF